VPTVLLLLLSLVGFASGAVVTRRWRRPRAALPAHPAEVIFVAVALTAIVLLRPQQQRIAYALVCAAVMVGVGMVAARAGGATSSFVLAGTREFEQRNIAGTSTAWQRYLSFSRAVVDYEFRLVLVATYLLLVAPIAFASGAGRRRATESSGSNWLPRSDSAQMENARRPF
jgi:hypothetical protein